MPPHHAVRALEILAAALLLSVGPARASAAQPAGSPRPAASGTLRIGGTSTMGPLVEAIARRFCSLRPDVRISVESGGSVRSIEDLRAGKVEIAMAARASRIADKDLVGFPLARDGVGIIVHKANPVQSLSSEQVKGIFSGRITTWRSVGGGDGPLVAILRERSRSATQILERHFDLEASLRGKLVPGVNIDTMQAVAADPAAIGYVSSGDAEQKAKAGLAIRLVAVDGVLPTPRNVITGNYPFTRALSLITGGLPTGATKEFVDYCLSPKVTDLVVQYGFVPYGD